MAREAQEHQISDVVGMDMKLAFAGGLVHDVGKTFLPLALVVKELGIGIGPFTFLKGTRLNDKEKAVIRLEHLTTGTTYVREFGGGRHIKMMLDMVGLHHVMFDGRDTGVPSYPSLMRGMDLPFHSRMAKTADLISAAMPRHYRTNGFIVTEDDSLAHAITVAGNRRAAYYPTRAPRRR
jgi:HD-GYP domain-containing protein (c-di-GMP phosphodiesterase class II)